MSAGLDARGGGFNALARQAVAALLNAAHPDIDYDLTEDQVKAEFQEALASGDYRPTQILFENLNKQGCPIDGK